MVAQTMPEVQTTVREGPESPGPPCFLVVDPALCPGPDRGLETGVLLGAGARVGRRLLMHPERRGERNFHIPCSAERCLVALCLGNRIACNNKTATA